MKMMGYHFLVLISLLNQFYIQSINGYIMDGKRIFLRRFEFDLIECIGIQKRALSDTDKNTFRNEVLEAHNTYRKNHCVPKLTLDAEISAKAQKFAEVLASSNKMYHDNTTEYGENLYAVGGGSSPIKSVKG